MVTDGPSKLQFCNVVSLLYIVFICVLFCLPNYYPVTA